MPYQLPLTYRQIEDQYNKARSSGLFSEGNLQDYAKVGDQFYPGKYQAVSDKSWLGLKAKALSTGIDRALESTGLPDAAGDLSQWAFEKFGGTPEVGHQVGETIPRAAGAMALGMGVGKVAGGLIGGGLGLGAAGVGAVPGAAAGQEIGGWIGGGLTAFLFGLDAYEKSDSLKAAAFAAAVPSIAGKFSQMGTSAAMKILPKIPGASKIGLTGLGETSKIVESATANPAFAESIKYTTRGLEGGVNKAAAFAGSQAGVVAGFAGIDALKGDVRFDPDYWLTQAVTAIPFGIPEAHQTFRPGFVPLKTTMGKPEKVAKPLLGPETLREVKERSFMEEYVAAKEEHRPSVIKKHGFDTVIKHSIIQAQNKIKVLKQEALKAANDKIEMQFAQEPEAVQEGFRKGKAFWAEKQRIIKNNDLPKVVRDAAQADLRNPDNFSHPEILKALRLRDRLKKAKATQFNRELRKLRTPDLDLIELSRMSVLADNDLRLFGLNHSKLLDKPKGQRNFDDYVSALKPKGWSPGEIKDLFISHLKDAFILDKKSISPENIEKHQLEKERWFNENAPEVKAKTTRTSNRTDIKPQETSVSSSDTTTETPVAEVKPDNIDLAADQQSVGKVPTETPVAADPVTDPDLAEADALIAGKEVENTVQPEAASMSEHDKLTKSLAERAARLSAMSKGLSQESPMGVNLNYAKMIPELVMYAKEFIQLKAGDLIQHLIETFKLTAKQAEEIRSHAEKAQEEEYLSKPELKARDRLLDRVTEIVNDGGISDRAEEVRTRLNKAKMLEVKYGLAPMADQFRRAIDSRLQDVKGEFNTAAAGDRMLAKTLFEGREMGDTPNDTISRMKAISRLIGLANYDKGGRPEGYDEARAEKQKKFEKEVREYELKEKHGLLTDPEEIGKLAAYRTLQSYMTYPQYLELSRAIKTVNEAGQQKFSPEALKLQEAKPPAQGPKHPGDYGGMSSKGNAYEPPYSVLTSRLMEAVLRYVEGRTVLEGAKDEEGNVQGTAASLRKDKTKVEVNRRKLLAAQKKVYEKYSHVLDFPQDYPPEVYRLTQEARDAEVEAAALNFGSGEDKGRIEITLANTIRDTPVEQLPEKVQSDLRRWLAWNTNQHYRVGEDSPDFYETRNAFEEILMDVQQNSQGKIRKGVIDFEAEQPTSIDETLGQEEILDPVAAARGDTSDPLLVAIVKDMVRSEDASLGVYPMIENYLFRQLFNSSGQMKPYEKIPAFYQNFVFQKGMKGTGEPIYDVNLEKFVNMFLRRGGEKAILEQRNRYLDEMVAERKVDAFLTREQLTQERENGLGKFTMLDRMLDTIRQHPHFVSQIDVIRKAFNDKVLSPEDIIRNARYVESRPPRNVEPNRRARTADGRDVPQVVEQKFKSYKSYADKIQRWTSKDTKSFLGWIANEFGMNPDQSKVSLEEKVQYDNLRVEVLNYLWEHPESGSNMVIRPTLGRPVDPVRVFEETNSFVDRVNAAETGIDISQEIPPQIELPDGKGNVKSVRFTEPQAPAIGEQAVQSSAWTKSYLRPETLKPSPLSNLNDWIVRTVDQAKQSKSLAEQEATLKLIYERHVQEGKKIPTELQGGLRLIAETYGKKWESELHGIYKQATKLNVDAQKLEDQAGAFEQDLAGVAKDVAAKKLRIKESKDSLPALIGSPWKETLARERIKRTETELKLAEKRLEGLLKTQGLPKEEQAKFREQAAKYREQATELLKTVGPLQTKFDKMQSFAPGFRGAQPKDTDFLNFRPRPEDLVPAPEVHPESQKILDRLGEFTDGIAGSSDEMTALAYKMQDDGFVGTVVPKHEMGDLWIGKNDIEGLKDAAEGERLIAYFADPKELTELRKIKGLVETKNGNDILFHSKLPDVLDNLAKPQELISRALDRLGETDTAAAEAAVEGIVRLYSNASRVRFLDITKGSGRSGFTNVRGKVQKIWQQIPESWHGFTKGEKVRAYLFTLAHELSHGIEFAKNSRTLSPEGQKIYDDVKSWAAEQDPSHLADIIDVLKRKNLPKDWRDNPAIGEVLMTRDGKGDPRSVEEFMTNVDALMQVGFLEHNNADFRDAMRAMPVPVRSLWQWFMRKLQNFARAGMAVFKGQAKADSKWIVDKMSQLRKEANKADKDFEDASFFSDLQSDKLAERSAMVWEGMAEDAGKWEPLFRAAEPDDIKANTSSGATTRATAWFNRVGRLLFRLEPESLNNKPVAQVLSAMVSMNHWQKQATQKVLGPVFGTETGVNILGRQTSAGEAYEAYMKNPLYMRIGNLIRDWTIQGENVNLPKFVNGKFQDEVIFPQGSEGRRLWNNLSGEQKAAIIKHEAVIQNAYEMQKGMNLEGREHHFKALMAFTLGAKEQNMHSRAYDLSERLYETMKGLKSSDPMVAMKALQDYKQIESEFDNAALLKSSTEQAQEFIRMNEELKEFYDERKSYENIQQFAKYVTTMVDSKGKKLVLSSGTARGIQEQMQQTMRDNPDMKVLHEKTPNDTGKESGVDTKLIDLMGRHHQRVVDMVNSGMLGSFDAETKQGLIEAIGEATAMEKVARDKAAKTNYLPGTNRKGHEGFEKLDRTAQLFNYVSASNSGLSRAATKARALHELNSPELKNNLDLKNRLKQQVDQYLTPDSELGTAVTKWMAVTHLGFNWPSHIFELTQPTMMAIPALQRMGHTWSEGLSIQGKAQNAVAKLYANRVGQKLKSGMKNVHPEIKTGNEAYDDLLTKAAARDEIDVNSLMEVRHQQKQAEVHSKLMNGEQPEGKVSKILNAYADFSMHLYHFFPRHNNFVGHIMGYESAMKRINPDTITKENPQGRKFTHDEAVEEAIRFNRATMLTGGRAGRQADPFKNKTVGQIMMSLQSFSTGWLTGFVGYLDEAYSKERHPDLSPVERQNAKKAARSLLGTSIFFSGLVGAPFAGAMAKLASELLGEDLEAEARKTLQEITKEPALVDAIMEGGANMFLDGAGIPIDMSAKMGIGGAFGFNPITGYSAASLLGPTASLVNRVFESIKPLAEGDITKAISIGGPSGVRKLAELASNEGQYRSYDGSPLFDENYEEAPASKFLYSLGFGNQDVKKARTLDRLEHSVKHYADEKANKELTEIAGLVKDKSWLAQQKLMEYVNNEVGEVAGFENLNSVQQQMLYRKKYSEAVSKLATKVTDLTLPVDPRREVSDRSAHTMTALMSGVKAQMPPSSVLTRMALRDAVYQKMGIAPPETSRKEYNKAFMLDQIQNRNQGWTMPQVKNSLIGF